MFLIDNNPQLRGFGLDSLQVTSQNRQGICVIRGMAACGNEHGPFCIRAMQRRDVRRNPLRGARFLDTLVSNCNVTSPSPRIARPPPMMPRECLGLTVRHHFRHLRASYPRTFTAHRPVIEKSACMLVASRDAAAAVRSANVLEPGFPRPGMHVTPLRDARGCSARPAVSGVRREVCECLP